MKIDSGTIVLFLVEECFEIQLCPLLCRAIHYTPTLLFWITSNLDFFYRVVIS